MVSNNQEALLSGCWLGMAIRGREVMMESGCSLIDVSQADPVMSAHSTSRSLNLCFCSLECYSLSIRMARSLTELMPPCKVPSSKNFPDRSCPKHTTHHSLSPHMASVFFVAPVTLGNNHVHLSLVGGGVIILS